MSRPYVCGTCEAAIPDFEPDLDKAVECDECAEDSREYRIQLRAERAKTCTWCTRQPALCPVHE